MSTSVRVLFGTPRRELASQLAQAYSQCEAAHLVAGFMTVEGIDAVLGPVRTEPHKLRTLVVGAATWRALDAFDQLLAVGVAPTALRVHLGHSRATRPGATHRFYRYHPMLHSKVYLFDRHDGHARAYIGSHNLTGYALNGLNGEASVSIESLSDDPALQDVRAHVEAAAAEAVQYDPAQRDAYAWWSLQSAEGLADKFRDAPRDGESVRTIVIIAEAGDTPAQGDTVYLELPEGLGRVQSLRAEVHLFLFDHLPETPSIALSMLHSAKRSVWCRTVGIEDDRGGRELLADWYLDLNPSRLRRAQRPFRPTPGQGMQQVRVQAYKEVRGEFEYLFDDGKAKFEPVYDEEQPISVPADRAVALQRLDLIPPEDRPWHRVSGLRRSEDTREDAYTAALKSLSPEAGSFILMSLRRRLRG